MCAPAALAIASVAVTAGSAISSYVGAKNEADRQNAANAEYVAKNKQAAIEAANFNESELTLRQSQEVLAASAQIDDLSKDTTSKHSTAMVSASEAGVSGNSVDAIMNDISSKAGTNKTRIQQNLSMKEAQIQSEKAGVIVDAQNNINTVRQTVVRGPSILTPIFQTGAGTLNAADQYVTRNANANSGGH